MNRTVDVVIAGSDSGAVAAAREALRRGLRVLIVCRQSRGLFKRLRTESTTATLSVMSGAEVACVDGVGAPEAVVVRDVKSGRLTGVNTPRLLWFGSGVTSPRAVRLRTPGWRSAESRRRRRAHRSPSTAEP